MASGYTFHQSYYEATKTLSQEHRVAIFDAMNRYAFEGADTEFEDITLAMAWNLIKPNVESSLKRSKTNSENARKTSAKTVAKTTVKTTAKTSEETVASPDSLGMEWSGTDKDRNGEEIDTPSFPLQCLKVLNDVLSTPYTVIPEKCIHTLERHEGVYSVDEIRHMVEVKRDEWQGSGMERNLTPHTLFSPKHFEKYMIQSKREEVIHDNYDVGECIEI